MDYDSATDDALKKAASLFGKMGGQANVKKHGKERMKEISRLGVEAKKRKKQLKNLDNSRDIPEK